MDDIILRVAARFATRPIPLDKGAIRQLADNLARKIGVAVAKWDGSLAKYPMGDFPMILSWEWEAQTVNKTGIKVEGHFYSKSSPSEEFVTSGQTQLEDPVSRRPLYFDDAPVEQSVKLAVSLNGRYTWGEFVEAEKTGVLKHQLFSILIHELSHIAESAHLRKWHEHHKEYQGYPGPDVTGKDRHVALIAYYNAPTEVRAYMQQIVEELIHKASSFRKRVVPNATPHEFIMRLLQTSRWWKIVAPYLKSENEAKILKAVYDALAHAGVLS